MSNINLNIIKKVIAFLMVAIWLVLIYKIFKAGGTMSDQLPKYIYYYWRICSFKYSYKSTRVYREKRVLRVNLSNFC